MNRVTAVLLLAVIFVLDTEYLIQAKPTSSPPVQPTNASALFIPGQCEVFPPGECQNLTRDECDTDQQCQDIYTDYPGLKCCRNYCGIRVCDLPVNIQSDEIESFVCPVAEKALECPSKVMHECKDNSECSQLYPGEGLMCCKDGCDERYCETPESRVQK